MSLLRATALSPEVYYTNALPLFFGRDQLDQLEALALQNPSGKARLCTHLDPGAKLHSMLVAHTANYVVRPHKHAQRDEIVHVLKGNIEVLLFDESGKTTRTISMSPLSEGGTFFAHIPAHAYHTFIIQSPVAVFHESTLGPFQPDDCVFLSQVPLPAPL